MSVIPSQFLDLSTIRTDLDTQMRVATSDAIVDEYCEVLDELPPPTVFQIEEDYVLVDGFHRYAAYQKCGRDTIPCEIIQGSLDEAREYACCANKAHGLRRNDDDKRKAVEFFFKIPGRDKLTNSDVARKLGVSVPFVKKVRGSLDVKVSPASHHGAGSDKCRFNDLNSKSMELNNQQGTTGLNGLIPHSMQNGNDTINIDLPTKDVHKFALVLYEYLDSEYVESCVKYILDLDNKPLT